MTRKGKPPSSGTDRNYPLGELTIARQMKNLIDFGFIPERAAKYARAGVTIEVNWRENERLPR